MHHKCCSEGKFCCGDECLPMEEVAGPCPLVRTEHHVLSTTPLHPSTFILSPDTPPCTCQLIQRTSSTLSPRLTQLLRRSGVSPPLFCLTLSCFFHVQLLSYCKTSSNLCIRLSSAALEVLERLYGSSVLRSINCFDLHQQMMSAFSLKLLKPCVLPFGGHVYRWMEAAAITLRGPSRARTSLVWIRNSSTDACGPPDPPDRGRCLRR
jgi:hypothetical protein